MRSRIAAALAPVLGALTTGLTLDILDRGPLERIVVCYGVMFALAGWRECR